ncbi:FAD-dependent oxidoreductase [Butyrivibrio sp. AE3004]|uniref:FAD-dependent oxidoreductase n=1 Tax=Butyrivibrio sp. AE3004 TaxID=1506994 RepID=UPI00049417ED|nr:FAD-dependent oxidoreductase [Butyrivibrio sp. AE3004]
MSYEVERYKADIVVIGGGLAGSTAALQAREEGQSVIVLETGNTYRSGCAGTGVDHIFSYVPPVHEKVGYTKEDMKKDMVMFSNLEKGLGFTELGDLFVEKSFDRIIGLEKYGINFDFGGKHLVKGYRLVPQWQSIPTSFHFEGRDIKVKLTEAMKKAGVQIINRAQGVRILTSREGKAAGAIAISTREEKLYVISSKAVILTTNGIGGRLGEKAVTTYTHLERPSASTSGSGISLSLRAGAEVTNLEFALHDSSLSFEGFNFPVGAPGGSWWPAGRLIDEQGNVVVERTYELDIDDPDYVEKNRELYAKYNRQKKNMKKLLSEGEQLYVDFSEATDEEIEEIRHALANEGRMWLWLKNFDAENLDLKSVRIPYKEVRHVSVGGTDTGVLVDGHCESTVENLYAAGDVMGAVGCTCAPGAVVYGYEAGLQASIKTRDEEYPEFDESQVEEIRELAEKIRSKGSEGTTWKQLESTLQSIVGLYGRFPISDAKIENALDALSEIRDKLELSADNPHDVAKAFEVLTLLDSAEAIFTAASIRTESFGGYVRKHTGDIKPSQKRELYGLFYNKEGKLDYKVHATGIK